MKLFALVVLVVIAVVVNGVAYFVDVLTAVGFIIELDFLNAIHDDVASVLLMYLRSLHQNLENNHIILLFAEQIILKLYIC